MIYLDYAATSPVRDEVMDTFVKVNRDFFANTSSSHKLGFTSAQLELKARQQIAHLFQLKEDEVIFTSGATESNNLAIKGTCLKYHNRGNHIITTLGEHASVLNCFKYLEEYHHFRVTYLELNSEGKINFDDLKNSIDKDTIFVSIMAVNNETGAINEIENIAKYLKQFPKIMFHVDATQAIGKINISFKDVDLVSLSAHKINGFKGSGALLKKERVDLLPILSGGGQEFTYRSGTTNFPYEVCLAKTLRLALEEQKEHFEYVSKLNKILREELLKIDGIGFNSPIDASPYILNFYVNKKASVVSEALSNKQIYVSTQSACSSKKNSLSHVLKAMGKNDLISENSIRISLSYLNKENEMYEFCKILKDVLNEIR